MVAMHACFLVACAAAALRRPEPPAATVAVGALLGLAGAHALRWWAMATLGARWTTRVLVVPGAPPVTGGPYGYLRHPNYLAVVIEMAAVPLVWGSWGVALAFSVANALVLAFRIRAEEAALGDDWERAFRGRRRLVPGGRRDAA
jgi:methyltransferase